MTTQADTLLAALQQQLTSAMQAFHAGQPTDVAALEATTQELMESLNKLPAQETVQYLPEFQKMSAVLESFLQFLRQQQDTLRQEITTLNDNKKAHSSYKTTQAANGEKKE